MKNKADADLFKPGAHITATNTTSTNYNGLVEKNASSQLVVDKNKDITADDSKTGNWKAVAGYTVVKSNADGIMLPKNESFPKW